MQDNRQYIAEQAADWFVRLRDGTPSAQDREAFSEWLLDSPIHMHEYLAIAQLFGDLSHIDPNKEIDIESLLPADTENSNVISLKDITAREEKGDEPVTGKRSRLPRGIAASIISFAIALGGVLWINQNGQQQHYATAIGEQRSIALDDGSIIEMNTQSKLTVQLDKETRRVHLIKGEVIFDVQRDPDRPFIVDTGNAQVKVLGTKFNIYKQANNTVVTVLHGKVTVASTQNPTDTNTDDINRSVELTVGEQVQIAPQRELIEKISVNVQKITAWQDRRLIFEAQTLEDIVNEFNRYNTHRIEVTDSELAKLTLSGVFESNDPDSLIKFLQHIRAINVVVRADGLRVITAGETRL